MSRSEIGFQGQRPPRSPGGFVESALFQKDNAQIVECLSVTGLVRQRAHVAVDRRVCVALGSQDVAGIAVRIGKTGLMAQRLTIGRQSLIELALRLQHIA